MYLYLSLSLSQVVQETNSTHRQQEMTISNQQLLLRQSLLQSNELRDRLSQIQQLASGIDTPTTLRVVTPGVAPPRRTPSQSYHHASITRFDSFMSLQSTLSEKFFDALDDVSSTTTLPYMLGVPVQALGGLSPGFGIGLRR